MSFSIVRSASRCASLLVAVTVAGGVIAESQAQTVGKNATMTSGVHRPSALRSEARTEQPAEKTTRHLAGTRPQGSLHRYYQEQSRAQAAHGIDAPSSRRMVALELDANWNVSVANPFSDEAQPSVVPPPDALEAMRPLNPDSYLDVPVMPVVAPPPAELP
jgi:hypothetical protein